MRFWNSNPKFSGIFLHEILGSIEVNAPPMHRVAYIKMVIWVYAPPPFIIWNNKVKNVKNIAILFKLLLYICWFQKEPFFNLFFVFKFFICSPNIATQFHLKLRWICRPPLALATWTCPWSSPKMTSRSSPWRDMLSFACVVASEIYWQYG